MTNWPELVDKEAPRSETGNTDIAELNKMLKNGETAENINNKLDEKFLENLKQWLHPDTAKQLRDSIKNISGYEKQESLKKLYDYVVSICDVFDTAGKENNEHEGITSSIEMSQIIDNSIKERYLNVVNFVDYVNTVARENNGIVPKNFLSAVKGVLNWEKISWSFLVKMAEFLWIKTKDKDDKYNKGNKLKNLWKDVFSVSDQKWLFQTVSRMYWNLLNNNNNVKAFKEKPFEKRSLSDICTLLKIDNWDWSDNMIDNNTKVKQFCNALQINMNNFVSEFKTKNKERKNNNDTKLSSLDITKIIDTGKITKIKEGDTRKYFVTEGETKTEFTTDNFMEKLSITNDKIQKNLEWTLFVGTELNTAINNQKEKRFNKISQEANETQAPSENTEVTPAPDKIKEDDIKETKMRWKTPVKRTDVVDAINKAIESISKISDDTQKKGIIEKINTIIKALKTPWEKTKTWWQPAIEKLQNTMKEAGQDLIIDWKFWPNTFNAMKNYIKAETTTATTDEPNDPESDGATTAENGTEGGGESTEVERVDYKKEALKLLTDDLKLAGKDFIKASLKNNDAKGISCLQLALLPEYKWKIDWKFGPQTLSALQKYITIFRNTSRDNLGFLWSTGAPNIIVLNQANPETSFVSLCERTNYWTNKYTAYFTDWKVFQYGIKNDKLYWDFTNVPYLSWLWFTIDWNNIECFENSKKIDYDDNIIKNNIALLKGYIKSNPAFFNIYKS